MESKHLAMLKDIRRMVDESGVEQFLDSYPFRSRADHMYRSYCWAKRILPCRPDADAELTLVATLFHDIGVIRATPERLKDGHDLLGADIACDYLVHHGYSAAFADTAAALIAGHQQRDLLQTGQTTIEHIILMEADMLDERGALASFGMQWRRAPRPINPTSGHWSASKPASSTAVPSATRCTPSWRAPSGQKSRSCT